MKKSNKENPPKKRGRPFGAASVKTREIANRCIEEGKTPLEIMIISMREFVAEAENLRGVDNAKMLDCFKNAAEIANKAAPYIHPRLALIQHNGIENNSAQHSAVLVVPQILDEAAWAAAAAGRSDSVRAENIIEAEN